MANEQNLLKGEDIHKFTPEEHSKGGKASGEARRLKRDLRRACEMLLEMDIKGKDGTIKTGAEAIAIAQLQKALKGDAKAFEVLRDTAGQKPVERIMVAEVEQSVIDEVERAILDDDETASD